ncbi:MAG: AAA family ATPase [Gammaproteobacteria bacterium]|nr:AAA family ATPase [Gammaproteobacteria bacterium]
MSSDNREDSERDTQQALITALARAEAFPHRVEEIRLIETHISWVMLTGDYAYKIKKCVNFGFLDFSTLARRRHFCEEEIRLNGRLAPDLYLAVVPITGPAAQACIGGSGEPLEYAVKMRQFDLRDTFDALLARHALAAAQMEETAQVLARFHATIAPADAGAPFGSPAAILQPALENFDQLGESLAAGQTPHRLGDKLISLRQWTTEQHTALIPTFVARKQAGRIRECHGDLHLRNIVLWEGRVTPFDGIEFNDNLRWIDVINELAFLLMDLDDHQQPALSRQLLNSYLSLSGDYDGLRVLRFYQIYRAMVRAKVAGLRLVQIEAPNAAAQQLQEIDNYLQLAEDYTRVKQPALIITHGLSGSGKTYLASRLAHATGLIHLRSDVERKRCFGLAPLAKTQSAPEAGIYTSQATQDTYQHLLQLARTILSAHYSVLVDATFLQRPQRDAFRALAEELGLPFTILHCEASDETLQQRVRHRQQMERDASEADLQVLENQQQKQQPLAADERAYTRVVQTAEATQTPDAMHRLVADLKLGV